MVDTNYINELGKIIGVDAHSSFDDFRKKARSFIGRHKEADAQSSVMETVQALTKITNATKGGNFEQHKNDPWETVVYQILVEPVKYRPIQEPENTDITENEILIQAARNELQEHLKRYRETLEAKKKDFAQRVRLYVERQREQILEVPRQYAQAIAHLEAMAASQIEAIEETAQIHEKEAQKIEHVKGARERYIHFLDKTAIHISEAIQTLKENPVVANIIKSGKAKPLALLVLSENDAKLTEGLMTLQTALADEMEQGIFARLSPEKNTKRKLALEGQQAVGKLLSAFSEFKSHNNTGILAFHQDITKALDSTEAKKAVWTALHGGDSFYNAERKFAQQIDGMEASTKLQAQLLLDSSSILARFAFQNDLASLENLPTEQRQLFAALNEAALQNGVLQINDEVVTKALSANYIAYAQQQAGRYHNHAVTQLAEIVVPPSSPYVVFGVENAIIDAHAATQIREAERLLQSPPTTEETNQYLEQANFMKDLLKERIKKIHRLETQAPKPKGPSP